MSKIGEIAEGWANLAFKKKHIERIAKSRMLICNTCEAHSDKHDTVRIDKHCIECGCPLSSKTRSLSTACPLNKWKSVKL
jgi:hypothetical protein